MMSSSCSRKGCFAQKQAGDLLFCPTDRQNWRKWMLKLGIAENPYVPENELALLLSSFQKNETQEYRVVL